ncbi:MAG TPA: hypothetical protein EYP33_03145 [Pyrodictium sp.]|nr:hypothetical protein [Pyrodictium sp.]
MADAAYSPLVLVLLLAPLVIMFSPEALLEGIRLAIEQPGSLAPVTGRPAVELVKLATGAS